MKLLFQALTIALIVFDGIHGGRPGRREKKNPTFDGGSENNCQAATYIREEEGRVTARIFGCGKAFQKEMENFQKKFTIPIFQATILHNNPLSGGPIKYYNDNVSSYVEIGTGWDCTNVYKCAGIEVGCIRETSCAYVETDGTFEDSSYPDGSGPFLNHKWLFRLLGESFKDTKNMVFVEVLFWLFAG